MRPHRLSAVIVTHDSAPELRPCLVSLVRAAAGAGIDLETIVVDNASRDESPRLARELLPDAALIVNRANLGFAAAANIGLRRASGTHVLLLNPDTVVNAKAIRRTVEVLCETSVGAAAPLLVDARGRRQRSWNDFPSLRRAAADAVLPLALLRAARRHHERPPRSPEWVIGAFVMTRTDVLAGVGYLTERWFMYGEDMEWCFRLRRAGYDIRLVDDAVVTHIGGASAARHYAGLERDIATEQSTLDWMNRSRAYAFLRSVAALGQLALISIATIVNPAGASLARARARRVAAIRVYGSVLGRATARKIR